MDESRFAPSTEGCAASGAEPGESICEDPVITRMPGPVQEVFYHLGLVQAFFLRSQGNQDHIVLQQSCTPYNFMLSRDYLSWHYNMATRKVRSIWSDVRYTRHHGYIIIFWRPKIYTRKGSLLDHG